MGEQGRGEQRQRCLSTELHLVLALFLWRQEAGTVTSLSRKLRKTLLTQKSLPVRTSAGCLLSPLLSKLLDVVE